MPSQTGFGVGEEGNPGKEELAGNSCRGQVASPSRKGQQSKDLVLIDLP